MVLYWLCVYGKANQSDWWCNTENNLFKLLLINFSPMIPSNTSCSWYVKQYTEISRVLSHCSKGEIQRGVRGVCVWVCACVCWGCSVFTSFFYLLSPLCCISSYKKCHIHEVWSIEMLKEKKILWVLYSGGCLRIVYYFLDYSDERKLQHQSLWACSYRSLCTCTW